MVIDDPETEALIKRACRNEKAACKERAHHDLLRSATQFVIAALSRPRLQPSKRGRDSDCVQQA
jgi:hypothetical protein